MCQSHDEGGDWWPGEEDPRIGEARRALLEELGAAARADPADGWIVGQRVAYLGEAGDWREAEAIARACLAADPSWCGALLGFALHGQGRFGESEDAFRHALRAMDEEERRRWTDPSVLLDGEAQDWLEDVSESGDRGAEERRGKALRLLWSLSDPLWLVEGNDRLTEHWARRTLARVRERARNPHGLSWGRDLEELLLRYGWEIGWERTAPVAGLAESVVGHQHPESRTYLPPGWVLADPARVLAGRWNTRTTSPRTGYAPSYAPVILPVEGEVMVFPHPGGARLVGRFELPEDTTRHAGHEHRPFETPAFVRQEPPRAGLFLLPLRDAATVLDTVIVPGSEGTAGVLTLDAPAGEHVVGLEVWSPARGLAGRLRHGLVVNPSPADVPTLSDLVLLDSLLAPAASLTEALGHLRTVGPLRPRERVVVGWEVQGLGWRFPEVLAYRLTFTRVDRGLLQRIGSWLGLSGDAPSSVLSWQEEAPARPTAVFRSVALDVPDLEEGVYRLRLELATAGRTALVSERRLVVRP
jgi:hypothetical protein